MQVVLFSKRPLTPTERAIRPAVAPYIATSIPVAAQEVWEGGLAKSENFGRKTRGQLV